MIICGLIIITGTKEQLGAKKEQIERNSRKTGGSAAALQTQRRGTISMKLGRTVKEKARKRKEEAQLRDFDLESTKKALENTKKGREEQKKKKIIAQKELLIGNGSDSAIIFIRQHSFFHFLCKSVMTSVLISFYFNSSMN